MLMLARFLMLFNIDIKKKIMKTKKRMNQN